MRRIVLLGRIDRVPVYVHWSVFALSALLLVGALGALAYAVFAVVALMAYFAAVLLHEWGHVFMARRRRCYVSGISLYPFVGVTHFDLPRTRLDHCVIAWGGVLFQGAVGLPMLAWIMLVGYTPVEVVNAFMAVFSYLTVLMVPLNLVPIAPLDGALAWDIVPEVWSRLRRRLHDRQRTGWKPQRVLKMRPNRRWKLTRRGWRGGGRS